MKAIDLIRWALTLTDEGMARLVADMHDDALIQPGPGGKGGPGNHTLWCVGHVCVIEGSIPRVLFGEKSPVEHWEPLFAAGTKPLTHPGAYPPFDEVLRTFRALRASTMRLLDRIGEAGLDQPPKQVPPGFEDMMKTTGQALLLIALHQMVHYGQIADARRAAGRAPLL